MGAAGGEVIVTAFTNRGAVRPANEDSLTVGSMVVGTSMSHPVRCVLPRREPCILAVADGIGGHAAGEIASEHLSRRLAELGTTVSTSAGLTQALTNIDDELKKHARSYEEFDGMGTTVAGILIHGDGNLWFNVGDSRAYRIEGNQLVQITVDDSLAAVSSDGMRSGSSNFITQSLGGSADREMVPHTGQDSGKAWLLCSDGLSDLVPHEEMERLIAAAGSDEEAVHSLWQSAMEQGGKDNIAILLARER